ncbi:7331_t:CDS:2 [Funneliformis mosseae]|uniref:7331_t:CDS:1 n=1 Tax=Funneliformis mosseae TaxID=27381 RepID=A0A9N9E3F8_FUNMO|nr:7331_t:CDS:2 [Funneliformis mosseae]
MSTPVLTEDCIFEIFDHLRNDRSTLHKSLFVNRLFCRNIVPILYKKPFRNVKDHLHYYLLINTYLACLNEGERSFLIQNNIKIEEEPTTLFEYGMYLEGLPYSNLNINLEFWFLYQFYDMNKNQKYIQYQDYNKFYCDIHDDTRYKLIRNTLFHSFFRQFKFINPKYLKVRNNIFDTNLYDSQFFKEITSNLKILSSLHIYIDDQMKDFVSDFLILLSENCFNLIDFKVSTTINIEHESTLPCLLSRLIKQQKNLESFYLRINNQNNEVYNIFELLQSQKNTLTTLQLDGCHFDERSTDLLTRFERLESLNLICCDGIDLNICKRISNDKIKLKKLKLRNNYWEPNMTATFISSIGSSLTSLVHQEVSFPLNVNEEVYKSIITTCKNLDKFEAWIDSEVVLSYLANNLPNDLRAFTLKFYGGATPVYLEYFFINFNYVTLLQEMNFDFVMSDKCLEIILKYVGRMKLDQGFWSLD